jgi:17beta-estradiol 17-dehydrogenase / very-long-chain 3-oxoacyl-CoA reductase
MPDHYEKYAEKDSYMVVTGGSSGMGTEFCIQLAKLGFNVCIIGRNEKKIE